MDNIFNAFPSQYLKVTDLQGRRVTVTMRMVSMEDVGDGQKPVLYFANKEKGLVLNKTNATEIADRYGPNPSAWTGHVIELYPARVDFQGRKVEAIRVNAYLQQSGQPQQQAPIPQYHQPAPPIQAANPAPAAADPNMPVQQKPWVEKSFDDEIPF